MSGEGGTGSALELVTCDLSELSSCLCPSTFNKEGSGRRKRSSNEPDISPEEIFLCTWRRILSCEPTLIDRLIRRSRIAVRMGPKRTKPATVGNGVTGVKRKRDLDGSTSNGPAKKMKPLKLLSEKGKKQLCGKPGQQNSGKRSQTKNTNRVSARISLSKVKTPPCSLRSGRKLADIIKKKKLKAKIEKYAGSNATSESCKSNDETKSNASSKNDEPGTKKVKMLKKGLLQSTLQQHPGCNKSEGGASGSDEAEGKKRRYKRKKRDSMWVRSKKVYKKKESNAQEENEEEEESSGFDKEDDDDCGQISDVSMVSSATQNSALISQQTKNENEFRTGMLKVENTLKTDVSGAKDAEEKACDKSSMEGTPSNSDKKLDLADKNSKNSLAECVKMKTEIANSVVTIKVEDEMGSADEVIVEKKEQGAKDPALLDTEDSVGGISVYNALPSTEIDCAVVKNELVPDKNEELEGNKENICVFNAKDCNSPIEINDVPDCPPVSDGNGEPSLCQETFSPRVDGINKAGEGSIKIADVRSLMCDGVSKAFSGSLMDSCQEIQSGQSQNDASTELRKVPLSKELGILPNVERALNNSGNPESSLEDSKPDADSTTCDNPTSILDDSFGDLSLRISEDDDQCADKEHDQAMPDSTNASQEQRALMAEQSDFGKTSVNAENAVSVKTETADDSDVQIGKEEPSEDLTEEQKQKKESILHAIGLQPLSCAPGEPTEEKPPKRSDGYTGTLKAVIKLNRSGDKKHMVYKRTEGDLASSDKLEYRICSKNTSGEPECDDKKIASSDHSEASDDDEEEGSSKEPKLIIPEKSSSFSIHPDRLCSDVCSYCFGKFGSLDTPCHVAQLKGDERQRKILENEPHLTGESCLCDACYRFVDRKANFPEKLRVGKLKPSAQASTCCVTHCEEPATRTIKRKWLIKLKKSITNKLDIDIDKLGHGVYYPLCTQHHYWVEYFTVCGICRKRLNRNNLFSLGAEADRLNLMLAEDGIPARLSVNLFLCKLCRYYADLRLKYPDPNAIPCSNQAFYKNYRRKILISLDMPVSESEDEMISPDKEPLKMEGREEGKKSDDVMSLSGLATLLGEQPQQQARIQVKFGNVNIGTLSNLNIGQQAGSSASTSTSTARPASVPSSHAGPNVNGASGSQTNEPTYPDIALLANFEYQGPNTPDGAWERYTSTLQFDKKTKQLWTELQRPYGSQTSFLRHLVMLERVWRDGYLVLAPEADEAASRYITSARNRIRAFETQPPKMSKSVPTPAPAPSASVPVSSKVTTAPSQAAVNLQTVTTARVPISTAPSVTRPAPNITVRKLPQPTSVAQSFPLLTNTGEVEVTTVRATKPSPIVQKSVTVSSASQPTQPRILSTSSLSTGQQILHFPPQQRPKTQSNQTLMRRLTPLDRAKSLVRMAPMYQQIQQHTQVSADKRTQSTDVRFPGNKALSFIPPLVRLPQMQPTHFYHPPQPNNQLQQQQQNQHIMQQINQQAFFQSQPQQRMPLPKLPRNLTVMTMPARNVPPQVITLSHAGITIEKQMAPSTSRTATLPIERPSISVFREPTTP